MTQAYINVFIIILLGVAIVFFGHGRKAAVAAVVVLRIVILPVVFVVMLDETNLEMASFVAVVLEGKVVFTGVTRMQATQDIEVLLVASV